MQTTTKPSSTTVLLVCVHVEVTTREHKLARGHSETRKNALGKMIVESTKETYIMNILRLVVVYKVLIKPGSSDWILENCRISAGTRLF